MPRPFEKLFPADEVLHCSRLGWERLKNGDLLAAAEKDGFGALITVDSGIEHQQNLNHRQISILILRTKRNDMRTLEGFVEDINDLLASLEPGRSYVLRQ